jgi:hypothetical protein
MRTLQQALLDHELIVLRVIGEWYELDLAGADKPTSVAALTEVLSGLDLGQEIAFLSPEEAQVLRHLADNHGRQPVASFAREFGEVRQMGPGRLEQEEPWYDPVNAAEALWYRGFLYRGFDRTAEGVVEFYFLPEELARQLMPRPEERGATMRDATGLMPAPAPDRVVDATPWAVDDLTTILAAAQTMPLQEANLDRLNAWLLEADAGRRSLLITLAWEMGFLRESAEGIKPARTGVAWLRKGRESQLRDLAEAWSSCSWNELCHTPGIACEGSGWENDPILARTALLDSLPRSGDWFRVADLTQLIKETDPDFQRPDGNYDTWYIRDLSTDVYVSGFDSWALVEGRLLRFLITGPMHWLGLTDLGRSGACFRLTERALAWLAEAAPAAATPTAPAAIMPDGTILVPQDASRYDRFQIARVTEPQPVSAEKPYAYRLSAVSLRQARTQGIEPDRILSFLADVGEGELSPGVRRAVERWAEQGNEAAMERAVVLRVRDADILNKLRADPRTNSYLGESLGDLAAIVEDPDGLQRATAGLGLFIDAELW